MGHAPDRRAGRAGRALVVGPVSCIGSAAPAARTARGTCTAGLDAAGCLGAAGRPIMVSACGISRPADVSRTTRCGGAGSGNGRTASATTRRPAACPAAVGGSRGPDPNGNPACAGARCGGDDPRPWGRRRSGRRGRRP